MGRLVSTLKIVKFLLELAKEIPLAEIIAVPDLRDKDACQKWLLAVTEACSVLAAKTSITTDDTIVKFFATSIANDELFDSLHEMILRILDKDEDEELKVGDVPMVLADEADAVGINPLIIISIIQAVVEILRAFGLIKK